MAVMKRMLWLVLVAGPLAIAGPAWAGDEPKKPLTEAGLLELIQLLKDDDAIVSRVQKAKLEFAVNDDLLARLKKAGASAQVIEAVKRSSGQSAAEGEPVADALEIMVQRQFRTEENPLHSEVTMNGKLVDIFSGDSHKAIAPHLRKGWNTIEVKTTPQDSASKENRLIFRVGPMEKNGKRDAIIMRPVLWKFFNDGGWKFRDGKYSYPTNPEVKDSLRTYQVYYAGLGYEPGPIRTGDYVVVAKPQFATNGCPVTVTLFVNGTPLNTFLGENRDLVITPLLREGKNEVRIVSARVKDSVEDNDIHIEVGGPTEYSPGQKRYLYHRILQISGREGWTRNQRTDQWVSKKDPSADKIERTVSFVLDKAPRPGGR